MLSQLNKINSNYHFVSKKKKIDLEADLNVDIKKIKFKNKLLDSTVFKVIFKENKLLIENFKSNYRDSKK